MNRRWIGWAVALALAAGCTRAEPVGLRDAYPLQGMARPGQAAGLVVELDRPAGARERLTLQVKISRLFAPVAELAVPVPAGADRAPFQWTPPPGEAGYGVTVRLLDRRGQELSRRETALDVGEDWTRKPRYGFLSDFSPADAGQDGRVAQLARFHINGLQFYDWMYRHHQYLPPAAQFTDPLGRQLDLAVVREKADLARAAGMASMAYTAVYAAGPDFWAAHPDWGLYRQDGRPLEFGDRFLYIMNPAAGSPWRAHLLDQFRGILQELPFDGIHLDQYGDPKYGLAADGTPVDMARALAGLIDETHRAVTAEQPGARVIFNNVGNWPVRQTAPGSGDAVYIEVWAPYRHFQHLRELIEDGRRLSNGKAVVLAAYIHPQYASSVRLTDAAIFASGGYHLELGEGNGMLADPYFPKYGQVGDELAAALRRYYDFAVRWQELLYAPDLLTARTLEASARLDGARVMNKGYFNLVWAIGRENDRHQVLHLINLTGLDSADWNAPRTAGPGALGPQHLTVQVSERPERVYLLSADGPDPGPQELAFDYAAGELSLTLPRLEYWSTLVMVRGA